jgi:hypothetical protein
MSWCERKWSLQAQRRFTSIAAIVVVAIGSVSGVPAEAGSGESAAGAAAAPSSQPAPRPPSRARVGGSLEHRVDVLSKALQLDARQRAELLSILEGQRQAVSKIWSNPALLPAERAPATRAVEERTADQIRALLSDEQKKRYNPPKPQGAEPSQASVADWMQAQARQHP